MKRSKTISLILTITMMIFVFTNIEAGNPWPVAGKMNNPQFPNPSLTINKNRSLQSEIRNQKSKISIDSNPYRFSSYYCDQESDNYYLNARYYSPRMRCFISRDTYDLSNRYAYCNDDPISQSDPTGHMSNFLQSVFDCKALNFTLGAVAIAGGVFSLVAAGGIEICGAALISDTPWAARLGVAGKVLGVISGSTQILSMAIHNKTAERDLNIASCVSGIAGMGLDIAGSYQLKKLTRCGKGIEGTAYSDSERTTSVYKFYKDKKILDGETLAQKDARVSCSIKAHQRAGFQPEAVGRGNRILKSPWADEVGTLSRKSIAAFSKAVYEEEQGLMIFDDHDGNFGRYNGSTVVIDTGWTFDPRNDFSNRTLQYIRVFDQRKGMGSIYFEAWEKRFSWDKTLKE